MFTFSRTGSFTPSLATPASESNVSRHGRLFHVVRALIPNCCRDHPATLGFLSFRSLLYCLDGWCRRHHTSHTLDSIKTCEHVHRAESINMAKKRWNPSAHRTVNLKQRRRDLPECPQPEVQKQSTDSSSTQAETLWKEDSPFVQSTSAERTQVQQTPSSAVFTSVNFAVAAVCTLRCTRRGYLSVVASFGVGALQVMDHWLLEPFGAWSHHAALCKCLQPRV